MKYKDKVRYTIGRMSELVEDEPKMDNTELRTRLATLFLMLELPTLKESNSNIEYKYPDARIILENIPLKKIADGEVSLKIAPDGRTWVYYKGKTLIRIQPTGGKK